MTDRNLVPSMSGMEESIRHLEVEEVEATLLRGGWWSVGVRLKGDDGLRTSARKTGATSGR